MCFLGCETCTLSSARRHQRISDRRSKMSSLFLPSFPTLADLVGESFWRFRGFSSLCDKGPKFRHSEVRLSDSPAHFSFRCGVFACFLLLLRSCLVLGFLSLLDLFPLFPPCAFGASSLILQITPSSALLGIFDDCVIDSIAFFGVV